MPINKNRRVERAAVNAFRTLMECHDHIVQEIDGSNDNGEDVFVTFTDKGERIGDTIFVQIKGGTSYRTKDGYRVLVGNHGEYWKNSNAPVFCVVYDPDIPQLFWANASEQLRKAKRAKKTIRSIRISTQDVLEDATMENFVQRARQYIAETGELHKFLTTISGMQFDTTDYLSYFVNDYGEEMIFRQERGKNKAVLLHSDLDWEPQDITPEDLTFDGFARQIANRKVPSSIPDALAMVPTVGDIILGLSEALWLTACFGASRWIRKG
jgi:hypothetical protein